MGVACKCPPPLLGSLALGILHGLQVPPPCAPSDSSSVQGALLSVGGASSKSVASLVLAQAFAALSHASAVWPASRDVLRELSLDRPGPDSGNSEIGDGNGTARLRASFI